MFLIAFVFAYFIKQPILSFGTIFLFIYGFIFSSKGIKAKKHYRINLFRRLFCLAIPFLNFFMYLSTIGGNAGFGFTFSPLTLMQKLSFLLQVILIFLPEICVFLSRKNVIHVDGQKKKLGSTLYPVALILTICMAYG